MDVEYLVVILEEQQIEKKEIPARFPLVSGWSEKIRWLTLTIQRIKPNIGKKKVVAHSRKT